MASDEKDTLDVSRFLKPPDEDLICAVCLGVARDAVETECGHLFCDVCMNTWLAKSKTCPVDRQKIDSAEVRPTRYIRNKILNLKMKCTCGTTHSVRELNSHEQECINYRRQCETCDVFVKKSLYEAHLVDQFGLHYDALVKETKELRKNQLSLVQQNELLKEQMIQLKTEFGSELKLLKAAIQLNSEEKTSVPKLGSSEFPDSCLLDQNSVAILSGFLGGECQSTKLIYKASRDGFGAADFHKLCDQKGPTVSIIKRNGSETIYGGYTPLSWHSKEAYEKDYQRRSFIFTMSDDNGKPNKYKHAHNPLSAIFCHASYGPTFGGHDLYICNNSNIVTSSYTNSPQSYEAPSKTSLCGQYSGYTIEEIEVFSITK